MEIVEEEPLTVYDGAHNPAGAAALAASLPEVTGARAVTAVMSVLDDKNAAEMLAELLPSCERVIFTSLRKSARSFPGDARIARRAARGRADRNRDRSRSRGARSSAHDGSPAPTPPCS